MAVRPLSVKSLRTQCDLKQLAFKTTAKLPVLTKPIGQDRALAAINFGLNIQEDGYNLYLLGPSGSGKHHVIRSILTQRAKSEQASEDWCYVNNFADIHRPLAICLPAGLGPVFQKDMDDLIDELKTEIPAIFDTDEFRAQAQKLEEELKKKQADWYETLQNEAQAFGLSILTTPQGFSVIPMQDSQPMGQKEYEQLSQEERHQKEKKIEKIHDRLTNMLTNIPHWHKEKRDQQKKLQRQFTLVIVEKLIKSLQKKYRKLKPIFDYLNAVELNLIENAQDFHQMNKKATRHTDFLRYRVNVLVSHQINQGAPIIFEDNPTHANLIGRSEYTSELGALSTNFTLIRAGALHRANGGYLILPIDHLIEKPGAWDALKRALYAKHITLESLGQVLGFPSTVALEPEPIPLKLKIILIGERSLYYLLCEHDPNFSDLFKVSADFSNHIPRNKRGYDLFARLIATMNKDHQLRPLNRSAVAKLIDHSSRLASDSRKLYTQASSLIELLKESNYWAEQDKQSIVKVSHIQKAIDQKIHRMNRVETHIHEDIERHILLLDTTGYAIGQVNGLSVMQLGHYAFSIPCRITATARLGKGEVIDIEREVDLGGSIHSKGVLILSGFLNGYYSLDKHLSISASLVFEQSYGEIEGDSASAAELAALLSAIAHLPLKQSLAITGAINQHGVVQSIGGVNEKIEGFFKVCRRAGLDGTQGVLIPAFNVQHLMLHDEVIQAVKKKKFFIYAVKSINDVMQLLTGIDAGHRNKEGKFPEKSVNGRVEASLLKYAGHSDEESKSSSDS